MLAFYLPASYLDNPKVLKYNLDNQSDFRQYEKLDDGAKPYVGAEIMGGVFWDLRKRLTRDIVDKLIFSAWVTFYNGVEHQGGLGFMRIFTSQFGSGEYKRYGKEVVAVYTAHHVPS